jgi:hypothetical protein
LPFYYGNTSKLSAREHCFLLLSRRWCCIQGKLLGHMSQLYGIFHQLRGRNAVPTIGIPCSIFVSGKVGNIGKVLLENGPCLPLLSSSNRFLASSVVVIFSYFASDFRRAASTWKHRVSRLWPESVYEKRFATSGTKLHPMGSRYPSSDSRFSGGGSLLGQ